MKLLDVVKQIQVVLPGQTPIAFGMIEYHIQRPSVVQTVRQILSNKLVQRQNNRRIRRGNIHGRILGWGDGKVDDPGEGPVDSV